MVGAARGDPGRLDPRDGQLVSRTTFPDLAQAVINGRVPVVPEAEWLADPLKRGAYTLGDGSTTIRVPDYNGQSSGSVGRVFLSGDGGNSAGAAGAVQRDAMQLIKSDFDIGWGALLGRLAMDPCDQYLVHCATSSDPVRAVSLNR